jgi:hypothetical protein
MLSRDDIRSHLCAVIADIQVEAGWVPPALSDQVKPMSDLAGFDSLCGVDAEVRLSERLGVEIKQIPFKSRGRDQSIGEIVDGLCTLHRIGSNE